MANFSSYLEEELMDHVFNGASYSSPTIYLGIVSSSAVAADLEAGTLTNEITGYTGDRKAVSFGAVSQVGGRQRSPLMRSTTLRVCPL